MVGLLYTSRGAGAGGGGGDLAPPLPGDVVTKWRDMDPFWASREWHGVHLYGSVFNRDRHRYGYNFGCVPISCESNYLKIKGLPQAYQHPAHYRPTMEKSTSI